jgi:hypothetical protein
MHRVFLVLLGFCALAFAAQSAAQNVPLEKAQGHWDDHGCFHFEATAKVDVSVDELFQALARPEKLSAYRPGQSPVAVFVSAPITKQSMWGNAWTVSNPPPAKIIKWYEAFDSSEATVYFRVEYEYNRDSHTIAEHSLGSTSRRSICQPYSDAKYALSALDGASATSVRYTSTECVPPEDLKIKRYMYEGWKENAKQRLSEWLETAEADARVVAQERAKKPSAPWSSATPSPGVPFATSSPTVSPSGGVP